MHLRIYFPPWVAVAALCLTACTTITATPNVVHPAATLPVVTPPTRVAAAIPAASVAPPAAVRVLPSDTPVPSATARPTATARPSATPLPTATPVPPLPVLRDVNTKEENKPRRYAVETSLPSLSNDQAGAAAFNSFIQTISNTRATAFKKEMETWEIPAGFPNDSALGVSYSTTLLAPGVVSILIENFSYYAAAAHPNMDTMAVNFDLVRGVPLTLDSQFKPTANGLKLVADYCTKQLKTKLGKSLDEKGAAPTTENYARWNLTPRGLLITFDAYQVAAYAAGPQEVLVPRSVLKDALLPGSELDKFTK